MTDTAATTIARLTERINAISLPGPGFTRPSYSDEESAAHRVIEDEAQALGLAVSRDAAGNLFARLRGRDAQRRPLFVGSHLDTVGQGGAWDGTAGVAGAMALVAGLVRDGVTPASDIVVTVTRAEESVWFPGSYIGSRGAVGRLGADDLALCRSDSGETLAEHMRRQGLDPEAAVAAPGLPPARFVEFHIEQGPVLERRGLPFALVGAVRGGLRYRTARIHGIWAHSGGAPREGRADTVFAFSDLVQALDRLWAERLAAGDDLAVTFGIVDAASPVHAMAKVPGRLGFCLDLRSGEAAVLEDVNRALLDIVAGIEAARPGIRFDLGPISRSAPARLSAGLVAGLDRAARAAGHRPPHLLSGGGHDAAAFAAAGWDSAMIFLRNWNGSHCPEEGMDPADLAAAVGVLDRFVRDEAAQP
jgi:N-carbamoyl-L-amino-acid hydrolase